MSHRPINKNLVEDIINLTSMQEGMLYHYLVNPESNQYFEQFSYTLSGQLDLSACLKAWNWTISQNEVLRMVFRWENIGSPVQIVLKVQKISFQINDLTMYGEEEKVKILSEVCREDGAKRFDLAEGPLFRVMISKVREDRYVITISNHHILFDGWSNGIILGEFMKAYTAFKMGEQPEPLKKPRFMDYVKWIISQDRSGQEKFWKDYLKGYVFEPLLLPEKIPAEETGNTVCSSFAMTNELIKELQNLAKEEGVTLGTIFTAAWGVILQRCSGRNDVLFGTTVSGRSGNLPGIEHTVGLLMNTIPMRVYIREGITIREALHNVQNDVKARQIHETTPLVEIQRYAGLKSSEELFDTLLVIENYPLDMYFKEDLKVEAFVGYSITNYSLLLAINNFEETTLNFVYNNLKYEEEYIELLKERYICFLSLMAKDRGRVICEISSLTETEKMLERVIDIELDYEISNLKRGILQ